MVRRPRPSLHASLAAMAWIISLLSMGCIVNPVPTPGGSTFAQPPATDIGTATTGDGKSAFDAGGEAMAGVDAAASITPEYLQIEPLQADPGASPVGDVHLAAWAMTVVPSGKLVVFLPAAGHKTGDYKRFLAEAARLGHRAVALAGPGNTDVAALCGQNGLCFETVRKEIADGADHSDKLVVKYADSVENRLTRALLWLQDEVTEANWGAYLDAGKPDWSQIIVAGHGQGGAQAMMLATLHPVARVALLAAPTDADKNGPATWLATHKTPSDRIAGFCHAKDAAWPAIAAAWTALGLGGASARIDVDVIAPPHFGHHQMTTAATAALPTDAVATDDATPLDQDVARFAHVWRGLLGK